jgi:hypothetical protein
MLNPPALVVLPEQSALSWCEKAQPLFPHWLVAEQETVPDPPQLVETETVPPRPSLVTAFT